ncbi:MAG: nucleotidyltransferase domain-containing protein [Velocimicrobium sp.]
MKIDERISFLNETKRKFLLAQIKQLTKRVDTLEFIVLFGSYARGEERATSDMDLLVITEKETSRLLRGELCSLFDERNMDLVFYTLEQFKHSECLLIQKVKQEGIVLWKKS